MTSLTNLFLSLVFVPLLSIAGAAQVQITDAKLENLKGPVKTVVRTSKAISGYADWVLKDKTKYQTTEHFNKDGDMTESIHEGGSNQKYVYSKVDGHKTFKSFKLKAVKSDAPRFSVLSTEKEEPIEPGEKLTAPDPRYEFKYVYETSNEGRVVTERQFTNTGKLFRKRVLTYDKTGFLTHHSEEDSVARMTYSYKYDDKGNEIEVLETRDIKQNGSDSKTRTTYTEMKFDSMGNWTERKTTSYSDTEGIPKYNVAPRKYVLVNLQSRTITYH